MSETKQLETMTHSQFAERGQLIRWCHDLSLKELKALKRAYDASKLLKKGRTK